MIDIVITTCNRLALLKETLAYVWARTTSPYRLHVLDDASDLPTVQYLRQLAHTGKIADVYFGKRPVGIPGQLRRIPRVTQSDPVIFSDDDILVPRLDPDWLARGMAEMARYADLGMLALNTPGCNVRHSRGDVTVEGNVSFCRNVPGSFVFVRRAVLENYLPPDGTLSPVKRMCKDATAAGWRIGYLTHVYCQHIGTISVRNQRNLSNDLVQVLPVDPETLAPPEAFRW